jgi:hypothetical protein
MMQYAEAQAIDENLKHKLFADGLRKDWDKLMDLFDKDPGGAKQNFAPHRDRLFKAMEAAARDYKIVPGAAAINEGQSLYDEFTLGDDSNIAKARKAYQEALKKIAPHAAMPWAPGLRAHVEKITALIDTFNWGDTMNNVIEGVDRRLECVDLIKDALGGRSPDDLPEEGQKIVAEWAKRIEMVADLFMAGEDRKLLIEMLSQTAK